LNSHRFNLVIRFAASAVNVSPFCWDCKGRNLFVFVKLFIFYFFEGFNTSSKIKTLTDSLFTRLSNYFPLILLTVSLPPKRDAKVGKISVQPNNI
jgi:hypothetical protein